MIYTVELNFSDPKRTGEWNAWYESYLKKLITLPGLSTAQRFRAVEKDAQHWEYLALYSIVSLAVYETDAYRKIGGGGQASLHYKGLITRRREALFASREGLRPARRVQRDQSSIASPSNRRKSRRFAVTSVSSLTCAIAAIWPSAAEGGRPRLPSRARSCACHTAASSS